MSEETNQTNSANPYITPQDESSVQRTPNEPPPTYSEATGYQRLPPKPQQSSVPSNPSKFHAFPSSSLKLFVRFNGINSLSLRSLLSNLSTDRSLSRPNLQHHSHLSSRSSSLFLLFLSVLHTLLYLGMQTDQTLLSQLQSSNR